MSSANSPAAEVSSAELGVVRTMTTVLAAATLLFLALSVGSFVAQVEYTPRGWQLFAGLVIFGAPLLMAAVAPWIRLRHLRILHGTYAFAFSAVTLSWIPAFTHGPMPTELVPWPIIMTALGTAPAAIAWKPRAAWIFLVVNALLVGPIRIIADGGADVSLAIQYAFFTVTVCAVFTGVVTVAVGAGREVDVATAAARASSMRAAALTARGEEQAHLDALVHDEVIATIFAAAGAGHSSSASTRDQAARTIARLSELREATASVPELINVDYLIQGLASSVSETTDAAKFIVTGVRNAPLPSSVASALIEATVEALRNSVVHAGVDSSAVSRVVVLQFFADGVEITITDDGKGFDPSDVPENRLGIVVSILGRMNALPGAHATVWSEPLGGTRVTVGWNE
ncbi:sensor histidine kinase [Salinibacterium sp. M195]|uniref:sensor histidine kinase n=1 Tax=Salinibacterium sp. M195 TaxID=2583374 RepID=UPI001C62C5D9|nr:ATP-binding protein [Salinibacterium sp. M195]QYH35320.1 ATP-binding protein [Salinibacterium sp. M195]